MRRHRQTAYKTLGGGGAELKAGEKDCKNQERVLPYPGGQWASFWPLPGPYSGGLPSPMLSLAWLLLGDLYSLLTNLGSAPPPTS